MRGVIVVVCHHLDALRVAARENVRLCLDGLEHERLSRDGVGLDVKGVLAPLSQRLDHPAEGAGVVPREQGIQRKGYSRLVVVREERLGPFLGL